MATLPLPTPRHQAAQHCCVVEYILNKGYLRGRERGATKMAKKRKAKVPPLEAFTLDLTLLFT